MFSKTCEYGIKASIFIAQRALESPKKVSVREIAEGISSPEPFTAKILQSLTRRKIIQSTKGPSGGFFLEIEELGKVQLSQIVEAIDGDAIYTGCGLGLTQCNESKPCPIHDKFKTVREELAKMLHETTLLELANGLDLGLTFLKR